MHKWDEEPYFFTLFLKTNQFEWTVKWLQGMTDTFIVDYDTPKARETADDETAKILAEIHREFVKEDVQVRFLFF